MAVDESAAPSAPHTYTDADYDPWIEVDSSGFVRFVRVVTVWYWNLVYRLEAHGVEHVPTDGAFILAPNHSSYTDPFLNVAPLPRLVRFMAKASMFEYPVMRTVMRAGGAFPVRRGKGDVFAMELARRLLEAGHPVVVYPEGTRFRDSLPLGPAKRGAARLAIETGVPIIPTATWGVKRRELYGRRWWQRPRSIVVYGSPIDASGYDSTPAGIDALRDDVWERVNELYVQAGELARAPRRRRH